MALTSSVNVQFSALLTSTSDFTTPVAEIVFPRHYQLASGTGAGQADKVWGDQRTLAASATEDLDLTGTLVDVYGATITMARVKAIIIEAIAGNTNNVVVGAASSNPWSTLLGATGTLTIRPGTSITVVCGTADATGYTVTAATGDLLKVANSGSGTGVTYNIFFVGCSV